MVATYTQVTGREVKNNAGGLVFQVEDRTRLERFLVLGTVGGTYYVGEREHTLQNLQDVERIIDDMGTEAVDMIREIGVSNRAPSHDPVLVAYAIAISNPKTASYALGFFNQIVRTSTHLYNLLEYTKGRRGWGRAFKRAVANWYTAKSDDALAEQLVKYKQRNGWSHRDVLRKAHVVPTSGTRNMLHKFATTGVLYANDSQVSERIEAAIQASETTDPKVAARLIRAFNLPRETVNNAVLQSPEVWEALLPHMGATALLRNLRNMAKSGLVVQGAQATRDIVAKLSDDEYIRRSRIHPAHVFQAQKFSQERNRNGELVDIPHAILNQLEDTFYMAFGNIVPTNKNMLLALDVSGSMGFSSGVNGATPREWSALVAMVTARSEPYAEFMAFQDRFVPLNITARDSLSDVVRKISNLPFGSTDCSLPMSWARKNNRQYDGFFVYTDSETWTGGNPMNELKKYRQSSGIHDARLCVVGMTATEFTIADPKDPRTLDVVGMDANMPQMLSEFLVL